MNSYSVEIPHVVNVVNVVKLKNDILYILNYVFTTIFFFIFTTINHNQPQSTTITTIAKKINVVFYFYFSRLLGILNANTTNTTNTTTKNWGRL